jgi:hypothetical protein
MRIAFHNRVCSALSFVSCFSKRTCRHPSQHDHIQRSPCHPHARVDTRLDVSRQPTRPSRTGVLYNFLFQVDSDM